ncbi:valine tRS [Acrasis kona]|uniref:Valine tRS n=1 Tax=Acrasis kona TaxID=1008807 RepID=A0AAW2Z771_9EUKA
MNKSHIRDGTVTIKTRHLLLLGIATVLIAGATLYYKPSLEKPSLTTLKTNNAPKLDIPASIKTIWINVGTHLDPVLPPADDKSIMVIGFEPNLDLLERVRVNKYERLQVIPAAVANFHGVGSFRLSNNGGASSSLAKFVPRAEKLDSGEVSFVPIVRLEDIMKQIPRHINVESIKIDAQGFDLEVIKSAGEFVTRFTTITAEIVANDDLAYYKDVDNSRKSWMAYMTKYGFKKEHEDCNGVPQEELDKGVRCEEANVRWRRSN